MGDVSPPGDGLSAGAQPAQAQGWRAPIALGLEPVYVPGALSSALSWMAQTQGDLAAFDRWWADGMDIQRAPMTGPSSRFTRYAAVRFVLEIALAVLLFSALAIRPVRRGETAGRVH